MENLQVTESHFRVDLIDGKLEASDLTHSERKLKDLDGLFEDPSQGWIDPDKVIYRVEALFPVVEGKEGGLFFGRTIIEPGKVGDEYFMTKGHFHLKEDRAEYYWGIKGKGLLLFMNRQREVWAEKMEPGSLHYIDSDLGHRTINIGSEPLIFGACWPSDAGHNYHEIEQYGFAARVKEIDGKPQLIPN